MAAIPGAVVLRTPVFELLQYLPRTESVRDVPLVVVPPVRARYYLADLAPGRSIVEHLVRGGQQVFAVSWRNPDPGHGGWDLDTYGPAVLDAMDAAEHIARTPRTSLMAFGSGGTITAMLLGTAAIGARAGATVTFAGTVLDREDARTDPLRRPDARPPRSPEARSGAPTHAGAGLHATSTDVARRGALAVPGPRPCWGASSGEGRPRRYVVAGVDDRPPGRTCTAPPT